MPPPPDITPAELQTEIDRLGFGTSQILMIVLCGGIMFAEGSEMLVMGSITTLLHGHWDLTPILRGTMVSIVFVGFCVGNLLSGTIGDRYGRRRSILLSYLMIGIFGLATAYAVNATSMIFLRFLVGVGCGIGFPSVYTMIPEVCPMKIRSGANTLMIGVMPLGELFASIGVWLIDPNLNQSQKYCDIFGKNDTPEDIAKLLVRRDKIKTTSQDNDASIQATVVDESAHPAGEQPWSRSRRTSSPHVGRFDSPPSFEKHHLPSSTSGGGGGTPPARNLPSDKYSRPTMPANNKRIEILPARSSSKSSPATSSSSSSKISSDATSFLQVDGEEQDGGTQLHAEVHAKSTTQRIVHELQQAKKEPPALPHFPQNPLSAEDITTAASLYGGGASRRTSSSSSTLDHSSSSPSIFTSPLAKAVSFLADLVPPLGGSRVAGIAAIGTTTTSTAAAAANQNLLPMLSSTSSSSRLNAGMFDEDPNHISFLMDGIANPSVQLRHPTASGTSGDDKNLVSAVARHSSNTYANAFTTATSLQEQEEKIYNLVVAKEDCSWRMLCEYSAIPAFCFFVLALLYLEESPHYLLSKRKHRVLQRTLDRIAWRNGIENVSDQMRMKLKALIDDDELGSPADDLGEHESPAPKYASWANTFRILGQPAFFGTTLFLFVCHFTKDFSVFGLSYVFPQFFASVSSFMSTAAELFFMSILGLPGILAAFYLTRHPTIGHRASLQIFAITSAASSILMLDGTGAPQGVHILCAYLLKCSALGFFLLTVVLTAESFPVAIRNSAVGLCTAVGRAGSISAPVVFEVLHEESANGKGGKSNGKGGKSFDGFIGIVCGLMIFIATTVFMLLPRETKGALISEDGEITITAENGRGQHVENHGVLGGGPPGNAAGNYTDMAAATTKEQMH
ncbi:unnamed protein product [Amoebophrya sp. A120]|nr:unnamed protein product [Amoebophrya sp. A120]|eukprot:GSA120T00021446001.1